MPIIDLDVGPGGEQARRRGEREAWRLLANGKLTTGEALAHMQADLALRIQAHGADDGCCANGCNIQGWRERYPCSTRLYYMAVRDTLSRNHFRFGEPTSKTLVPYGFVPLVIGGGGGGYAGSTRWWRRWCR
jgi:hypothetical protein